MMRPLSLLACLLLIGVALAADPLDHGGPLPLEDFDLQVAWSPATPGRRSAPAGGAAEVVVQRPFMPLIYTGSSELAVSDDGLHVQVRRGHLYDLRLRNLVDLRQITQPTLLGMEEGFANFDSHMLELATGSVLPVPAHGARLLRLHRLLRQPDAVLPMLADQRVGGCETLEALPGSPYAVGLAKPRSGHAGTWAIFLLDVQRRSVAACLRNAKPVTSAQAGFMVHRLMLALAASPRLDPAARTALLGSGAYRRRATIMWDRKLLQLRLQDDLLFADILPQPVPDIREIAWSADGSAICTRHDDRIRTWTQDWRPIASMPMLAAASRGSNSSPSGSIQAIMNAGSGILNPVLVDCRTLTCERDRRTSGLDPQEVFSRTSPEGAFAISGRWPGRQIRLTPAGLDWRSVREARICAGAVGVAVTDQAVYLTRLPDGAPRAVGRGLPGPPYGILSDPSGSTIVLVTPTAVYSLDPATAAVTRRQPLDAGKTELALLMTRQDAHVSGNGSIGGRRYDVCEGPLYRFSIITDPSLWPRFVSPRCDLVFDAVRGTVEYGSVPLFSEQLAAFPGWSVVRVEWPCKPGAVWLVEIRNAKDERRHALVDPAGRSPTVLVPELPGIDISRSRHVDGPVWSAEGSMDGGICLWNAESGGWAMIYPQPDGGVVAWSDDGYIAVPRQHADTLTLQVDGGSVRCGAFDLALNRPDKVLERIGLADPAYVALLRAAWERRVRKAGPDPERIGRPSDPRSLPQVRLAAPPAGRTRDASTLLRCLVADPGGRALELVVRVGGLEVERLPVPAGTPGADRQVPVSVQLQAGINLIEIEPLLADGGAGLMAMATVLRDDSVSRVRIAALGVSAYRDPGRNLDFAAADARDVAQALSAGDAAQALVLTDTQVRREALPQVRSHLSGATMDDVAILLVAAHGLVDDRGGYYLATHDTDFAAPSGRGIAVDELLAMLRASPARRRLLLIDCCHAGELDADELPVPEAGSGPAKARGLRLPAGREQPAPAVPPRPKRPTPTPGQFARTAFLDVGWNDGITVLAACRGTEASWESSAWGHGAFSQALLDAVRDRKADSDGDGAVDLAELGRHVLTEVPRMTGDRQHPEVRAGELDRSVVVVPRP